MLLFIPGALLTLMFASKENTRYSMSEFFAICTSKFQMVYAILNMLVVTLMVAASELIIKKTKQESQQDIPKASTEMSDTQFEGDFIKPITKNEETDLPKGEPKMASQEQDIEAPGSRNSVDTKNDKVGLVSGEANKINSTWRVVPLLTYIYVSSLFASLCLTLSRALSGFALADSKETVPVYVPPAFIALIIVCSFFSYGFLNRSLKHFNTIYVVPMFRNFQLFHNILSGGIFLKEFGEYNRFDFMMFMLGVSI